MIHTFELHRDTDVAGVSGTGVVADGIEWDDGVVTLRWRNDDPELRSTVHWPSIRGVIDVNCHGGRSRVVWTRSADPHAE